MNPEEFKAHLQELAQSELWREMKKALARKTEAQAKRLLETPPECPVSALKALVDASARADEWRKLIHDPVYYFSSPENGKK